MRGFGKIILFGEHAIVYGYPALAVGLSQGISAMMQRGNGPDIRIKVQEWQLEIDATAADPMGKMLGLLTEHLPPPSSGAEIRLHPEIPDQAGLGSSAAMIVGIIRAWLHYTGVCWTDEQINDLAFQVERVFHGTPSGIDNTVATFGGLCFLAQEATAFPYPERARQSLSVGKRIGWLLPAPRRLRLVIGNTRRPRHTHELVARVRHLLDQNPTHYRPILQEIGTLAVRGYEAICNVQWETFGQLLNHNQRLLCEIQVSAPENDRLCTLALEAGAWGAKLTGAGGGGCVIAFAPGREEAVLAAWNKAGFPGFVSEI